MGQGQVQIDRRAGQTQTHDELAHLGEARRLTRLGHQRVDQGIVGRLYVVEERVKDLRPVGGGEIGPHTLVEAPPGVGDRPPDLVEWGDRDVRQVRLVGRVLDGKDLVALDPPPADI